MKVYIAGPLWKPEDRIILEKIAFFCKEKNIKTFLPHRDVGIYEKGSSKKFFEKDSKEIDNCNLIIAVLDWKSVGSGTAWEIGYAYAKNIPVIALVEDLKSINTYDRMCTMVFNSVIMFDSLEKLQKEIIKRKKGLKL
ncbi:nucleoside 2-deoxyribosyltransferase [Candidatus Woesearchaeota archaeon]|nr:nucleoside 2-deoxyribosyltransferase [Candidatus Woesearchaeota archaeon]